MGSDEDSPSINTEKLDAVPQRGIEKYSWTVYGTYADKRMDKSVFFSNETCIPRDLVREFFCVNEIIADDRKITLYYDSKAFEATIGMAPYGSQNTDLTWKKKFADVLRARFPQWVDYFKTIGKKTKNAPIIRFKKRPSIKEYDIELIETSINSPILTETIPDLILVKYSDYSRNDVHDIFDRNTPFTPQSGKWGLRGIITHPSIQNDFIFFVTLGYAGGNFSFDEYVTKSGYLIWQSEPKQKLTAPIIKKLIEHDSSKNNIHLFLRTHADRDYTYLGLLSYVNHDPNRQQPVHFTWQILDWTLGSEKANEMNLELFSDELVPLMNSDKTMTFIQTPIPNLKPIVCDSKERTFKAKKIDHIVRNQKNASIGEAGEKAVIEIEKAILKKANAERFIEKIEHVSKTQGDGLGFDIQSITPDGEKKLIEVKTTTEDISTPFILTETEFACSRTEAQYYYLYRIFDFDKTKGLIKYYIITGDLTHQTSRKSIQCLCIPSRQHSSESFTSYN